MDLHDSFNVQRVFQALAEEWGCPVWMVRQIIQQIIDRSWENAMSDSETKALWDKYFPSGNQRRVNISYDWGKHTKTGKMCLFYLANKKKGCRGGG